MLRLTLFALLAAFTLGTLPACHHDPKPEMAKDEVPPLPPASGTAIGYLLDNASQLKLSDEQMTKLREIDESLAARNDGIATQLREIERPEEEEPPAKGQVAKPRNMAPGASPMRTTADAAKLHDAHNENTRDAIARAFAVLDPTQQATAKKLLDERGIASPAGAKTQEPPPPTTEVEGGVPLEP